MWLTTEAGRSVFPSLCSCVDHFVNENLIIAVHVISLLQWPVSGFIVVCHNYVLYSVTFTVKIVHFCNSFTVNQFVLMTDATVCPLLYTGYGCGMCFWQAAG